MNILSTIRRSVLGLLLLIAISASAADLKWPVKGEVDLSSTFCDFRPLHFHGGIDLRTGGTEGRRVYAPVEGYVWRIKYSYEGYGKGLYLKDNQGFIYVFGHLSRFSKKLEAEVRKIQFGNRKYQFDKTFKPGEIPVSIGELIAYSGQSGFGAPHIHFERRDPSNQPLNPLTNGFPIPDSYPPQFARLELIYQDSISVFANGERRMFFDPEFNKQAGKFVIEPTVLVQGPFGIAVKAYDKTRGRGFRLNIFKARLFIDDYLYYEVTYDKYNYDQTAMVDLSYDYYLTVKDKDDWHLLFNPVGKNYDGSKSHYENGGIFAGHSQYGYGLHKARIEIYDAAGNMSELEFGFAYAPPGNLFDIEWMGDSLFYLNGRSDVRYIDLNGVELYGIGSRGGWTELADAVIEPRGTSDYRVEFSPMKKNKDKLRAIRVDALGESGWHIVDRYVALEKRDTYDYRLDYSLTDGGILAEMKSDRRIVPKPRLEVVYEDGYRAVLTGIPIAENRFVAFYRDNRIKTRITRLEVYDNDHNIMADSKDVSIILGGNSLDRTTIENKDGTSVTFDNSTFYSPCLISLERKDGRYPEPGRFRSAVYEVSPETIPLSGRLVVGFKYAPESNPAKIGIYRLNSKNEWKWFDSNISAGKITAQSKLMGTFAVLEDNSAPRVKNIYPPKGKTVFTGWPQITCTISEELAGIGDDDYITVTLDGDWLIPEYDPEIELLKTSPRKELSNGHHELVIEVSDRVGNKRTVHSDFYVKKK